VISTFFPIIPSARKLEAQRRPVHARLLRQFARSVDDALALFNVRGCSKVDFSTVISVAGLAAELSDPSFVVIDVRSSLADPGYGRRAFEQGHIPGSSFANLDGELSDPPGHGRGRHPLPDVAQMAATFGRLGIDGSCQVVAYDDSDGMFASRLWWMLRYLGHDRVAVLDGGYAAWKAAGMEVSTVACPPRAPAVFVPRPAALRVATADDVESMRLDPDRILVDSRSPERFRGENETIDPVGGHIPGARNRFFKLNVREDGSFRPPAELEADFRELFGDTSPGDAVFYCGSGVTACHNVLAATHAGLDSPVLYAGSWSEWISDPSRPVATGQGEPEPGK